MMILVVLFFIFFFAVAIYLNRLLDRREEKRLKNRKPAEFK
jgi:preprotein translocase subunit SecG